MEPGVKAVWGFVWWALRFEAGSWRSLGRWVLRRSGRSGPAPGEREFAYTAPAVPSLVVFVALSALEIVVLELIVPWEAVRRALFVLGVWGLLLALGLTAALVVHPHVVGPRGLRVRNGFTFDIVVPWDAVTAVRKVRRSRDGRTVQVDPGGRLHVLVSGQTTVEVDLARPLPVTLFDGRVVEFVGLSFHADDAAGLVAAGRDELQTRAA